MKSTKRGRIIISVLFLILGLIVATNIWMVQKMKPDVHYVYNVEEDFKGCVFTIYDQEGEKPLALNNDKITVTVSPNGYVKTSSSFFFGLETEEDFFFRKDYIQKDTKDFIGEEHIQEVGVFEDEQDSKKFMYTITKVKTTENCTLDPTKL